MKKRLFGIILSAMVLNVYLSASASLETVEFDFDSAVLDSSAKSSSFKADNGTSLVFSDAASGTTVMVKNTDVAVVPDNIDTNQFIKIDYKGDAGKETAEKFTVTPQIPFKEDFTFEFDFALNRLGAGDEGYNPAYNPLLYITVMPNIQEDKTNSWKYGSKIVMIDQAMNIKTPITNMISPNSMNGYTKFASSYAAGSGFARMKVVTHFIENDYPVYDIYVRFPGSSEFETVVTGKRYATEGYGKAPLPASVYNDYGISNLSVTMSTGDNANAQVSSNIFNVAIDNIKIRNPETLNLGSLYSDKLVIPKNGRFKIVGDGLDAGSRVSAIIYNAYNNNMVLSKSSIALDDSSFTVSFDDTSILSEDEIYYIIIKSGNLSKRINSVLCGNVVVFDGAEGSAQPTENISRVFVDGIWYDPGEYTGYDYERTVAGNISGVIVGEKNVAQIPANYIVYTISDQNLDKKMLTDYVDSAVSEGKKVMFRGALKNTALSSDDVFKLEEAINSISRSRYGNVLFVPAFDGENYAQRMGDVLSNEKQLFNCWDISIDNNKVYLTLSDIPKSVYPNSFICEDLYGNIYTAESAAINGNTIELTFGNEGQIIKLIYGKEIGENVIYSLKNNIPLPRFTAEFLAGDKYDFKSQYDIDKFLSVYHADNADMNSVGETVVISQKTAGNFSIERKNLYYSADNVEIKIGVNAPQKVKLIADDKLFFEGTVDAETAVSIKRVDNKLYVNGEGITEDISVIQNLKVEFCDCSHVELYKLEISMPEVSKILTLMSNINNLPDVQAAGYSDKESIQNAYNEYVLLDGNNSTYFNAEQKSKMNELGNLLERYKAAEQGIKANILVKADLPESYTGKKAEQKITLTNKNNDVPYNVVCIAAAYSKEGRMLSISSDELLLHVGENRDIILKFDIEEADNVDIYILKDISDGYMIHKTMNIPVK